MCIGKYHHSGDYTIIVGEFSSEEKRILSILHEIGKAVVNASDKLDRELMAWCYAVDVIQRIMYYKSDTRFAFSDDAVDWCVESLVNFYTEFANSENRSDSIWKLQKIFDKIRA